jgi:hypothetical protein
MSELNALRTTLLALLGQRREKINAIPWKRLKSLSPTMDKGLIGHVILFDQWGFMDYLAARTLLLKGLDASLKPDLPRKFSSPEALRDYLHQRDRMYAVNLMTAGELVWPACALAATAVEKYCKAIITVSKKEIPKPIHLTEGLIIQVGNCVKNFFRVINRRFLKNLGLLYDLRYHTNMREEPHMLAVSMRGILAELDFTISQLDGCVRITENSVMPLESAYAAARLLGSQDLQRENYVLMGMEKEAFWKQRDLQGTLSVISGPSYYPTRAWSPKDNGLSDRFFSIVDMNSTNYPELFQRLKGEDDPIANLIKREAAIMHYKTRRLCCMNTRKPNLFKDLAFLVIFRKCLKTQAF